MEGVTGVFDAAVHVHAAFLAGMPLNGSLGIDHGEFVTVLSHADLVLADHRDHREYGTLGFPALGTAARVIVSGLRLDRDLDGIVRALAGERSALKVL